MEKIKVSQDSENALHDEQGRYLFDMSSGRDNTTVLSKITCEYTQESDGCSDVDCPNTLEITTEPDGYYVMKTKRWAFDNADDLISVIKDFTNKFTNVVFLKEEDFQYIEKKD